MTERRDDNLLIVNWHDTGRWLGAYGHRGVSSPCLDRLAAEGILFTRAHAAAPQCSPSRGAIFTGRYPHSNGLIGLAHHGFEYREGVRTLPQILSDAGWYSALFGMQHETSFPARLGFDEFDVSDSHCEYVVAKAQEWLTESAPLDGSDPFLLTAGFFETHRPWSGESRDRYRPAQLEDVEVPAYLPDVAEVRSDFADFYGAIAVADAAVGRLLDTLADTGLDATTWVVFFSDHGAPFPRAKSMLYGAGTEISLIIRPPTRLGIAPRVYDELFSGVDLLPTLLDMFGIEIPAEVEGVSHVNHLLRPTPDAAPARREVFTEKTFHDSFDPMRAIRTKEYSYIENYAPRHLVDLPLDIQDSPSGKAVFDYAEGPRPARELYSLPDDPSELNNLLLGEERDGLARIANELALRLHLWRERTGDVCPSEFAGPRILFERAEIYVEASVRTLGLRPTSRSSRGTERGLRQVTGTKQ
ncbi:sulfatase family protein [Mycobacterium sp.]|uniref:sulfatase family protein n=1 Tax=Mycobacterium sp. TaxID=1785 RepID=UPI003F9B9110